MFISTYEVLLPLLLLSFFSKRLMTFLRRPGMNYINSLQCVNFITDHHDLTVLNAHFAFWLCNRKLLQYMLLIQYPTKLEFNVIWLLRRHSCHQHTVCAMKHADVLKHAVRFLVWEKRLF